MTSLNLFATKFDKVLEILDERGKEHEHIIMDTPGQIEVRFSLSMDSVTNPRLLQ